jgi:hypothetical protein
MTDKKTLMTQTIQSNSWNLLNKTGNDLSINKPETEDSNLLLSLFDSMNDLHEELSRLNYLIERKILEQNIYRKGKGVTK